MRKEVLLDQIGIERSGSCVVGINKISKRFPLGIVLWRPLAECEKLETSTPSVVSEDAFDLYAQVPSLGDKML